MAVIPYKELFYWINFYTTRIFCKNQLNQLRRIIRYGEINMFISAILLVRLYMHHRNNISLTLYTYIYVFLVGCAVLIISRLQSKTKWHTAHQ